MPQSKPVLISPELHAEVRMEAAKTGRPISVVAEAAIKRGLREMNRPRKKRDATTARS